MVSVSWQTYLFHSVCLSLSLFSFMPHASGTPNISNKTSMLLLLYTEELSNTTVPSQLTVEQRKDRPQSRDTRLK